MLATKDNVFQILQQNPTLMYFGWSDGKETPGKLQNELLDDHAIDEIQRCCHWLDQAEKISTINHQRGSYWFKHAVERWSRDKDPSKDNYVSNGSFIAAALLCGFKSQRDKTGPNSCFNISSQSLKRIRKQEVSKQLYPSR